MIFLILTLNVLFRLLNDTEMMSYRLEKRNDLVSSRIMRSRADTASVDYDIGEHYMHDLKEGIKYGHGFEKKSIIFFTYRSLLIKFS